MDAALCENASDALGLFVSCQVSVGVYNAQRYDLNSALHIPHLAYVHYEVVTVQPALVLDMVTALSTSRIRSLFCVQARTVALLFACVHGHWCACTLTEALSR